MRRTRAKVERIERRSEAERLGLVMLALAATAVALLALATRATADQPGPDSREIDNPAIDMPGFLALASEAAAHRESRRLSEADFLRMSREPGTIVLDARSREKYDELHVRGAIHLSFPDLTVESLARVIPDRETRILIYCNNNFAAAEGPFPTKLAPASLNLSTYVALFTYGYRNVYELGPLVELADSRLEFASAAGGSGSARGR
jgi:hypothetical protein